MGVETGGMRHALGRLWGRGVLGTVTVTLAVLACYGGLALTALLPLVGIRVVPDESLWSGTIVLFTGLTVIALLPGIRAHGARMPAATAVVGAGLIVYALLVEYHAPVELAGFVLLAAAVIRDVHLHRLAPRADVTTGPAPG